jgi:ribosomal protein S18 acetylase RimI-like enzyme
MNPRLAFDCKNIEWPLVPRILQSVEMAFHEPDVHKKTFENSQVTVFVFDDDILIGFGRAISDGAKQAAIYDVAVQPEYQGKGIGKMIMESIMERLPGCNILLYANPGKEDFYKQLGFSILKTGMALFENNDEARRKGFIV